MRIGLVTVPYITCDQHFKFARETMRSAFSMHTLDTIAVVNACRNEEAERWLTTNFSVVYRNDRNNVARAWNKGIQLALERECRYVVVINLDIVFHPACLDNLVACAEAHPDAVLWSGVAWNSVASLNHAPLSEEVIPDTNFSCFMVDRQLFEKVGLFDEQYEPAYHEDADMRYRIKLAGLKEYGCKAALFFHFERATVKLSAMAKDDEFITAMEGMVLENLERYKRKWGGQPGKEQFLTPYNE